jgi:hypothetical protein
MAQTVKLLAHQARFVQAPYVYDDTRFFILCGGFACGKTSSLVYAVTYAVKKLLGKKDKEGHNPKVMVCSKNITFLAKTWTNAFEQNLKMTGSEYRFDRAKNIITVGNVELILVATEEPEAIYGYSCFRGDTLISTDKGEKPISAVKEGDFVLTTEGFKKVLKNINQGVKDCIKVTVDNIDIYCTPDHRFIDKFNNEIEAKDLTKETLLVKYESSTESFTTARLTAKTSNVVGQYTVYDLCVEGCHEFFANGVRVHNCALAVVDELDELPTEIAMEAVRSVNDRIRQQIDGFRSPFICFATTSQGLKGLYQTVMHFKKSGIGFVLMRARTKDNIYLPADYVKNMYSIYNEKEVKCLLEGEFISIDSGLVFPDYDKSKNMLDVDLFDSLEADETVYIGQDFNCFGNNAVAFVIKRGCIIAIKDYEFPDIRRAPEVFRYDFPTQTIVWIPDMTYKEHFTEFKKELRVFNIKIAYRSCNPLVADRNFACNKLFIAERLFICPICKDLERTLMTWQKDPKTGSPAKGGKGAPDHKGDCLGYVVHYLLSWNRELKPLYDVTLRRLYDKRRARGANATELEVTSHTITADKIKGIPLKEAVNVAEAGQSSK